MRKKNYFHFYLSYLQVEFYEFKHAIRLNELILCLLLYVQNSRHIFQNQVKVLNLKLQLFSSMIQKFMSLHRKNHHTGSFHLKMLHFTGKLLFVFFCFHIQMLILKLVMILENDLSTQSAQKWNCFFPKLESIGLYLCYIWL